jgi:tetratricopeptide (TPR) repeat protein
MSIEEQSTSTSPGRIERKLAAILSADVKGYSRLMGEDEVATIRMLSAYREMMSILIRQYRGRVVDSPGDNLLAEFASWALGHAYRLVGRLEEAIIALKRVVMRNPDQITAHLLLAVIYSELGREEEARAEVAEILRISPQYSLEVVKQRIPYKDPVSLERQVAALRKAGLK